ncbi:fimbrial protein, partial [Buttiauxella sp. B2]|uniref:fimbrial protein n=1 Tax=Buttiauxella sp. B2 TaxID=2587812 RepID=UPI0011230833
MKKKLAVMVFAALAGSIISGYATAQSAIVQNGGNIHFQGSLTDGPCAVQGVEDNGRMVILQQVETRYLTTPGEPAGQVKLFHIILNDCNTSVYTNVQVSFNGQTDATFKSVLVNSATTGAAEHVGLQLYGPDGEKIIPNDSSAIVLKSGFNTIPLTIDYVPTGLKPTAGNVESLVTFNIIY